MKRYLSIFLSAALAAVSALTGCQEVESLAETTALEIEYENITVFPNQGTVTAIPEIISGEPTSFAIIEVFDGETVYKGSEFSIDSSTGAVSANVSETTPVGDYAISVSCSNADRNYILKNVLTVSVIRGMPEQLAVDPATLNLRYEDLLSGSTAALASARVVTAGTSAAVTGYELRNLRLRGADAETPVEDIATYFTISDEGVITAVKGDSWDLATYVMDVKVNTEAYGSQSDEGLIANALTVNVAAAVITVTYPVEPQYIAPNLSRSYEATVDGVVEGGPAVTDFAITGVKLDGTDFQSFADIFSIDARTAEITAKAGADVAAGDYAVSISYVYAGQTLYATDVLTVHCRPGVPSEVTVTPASANIEQPDITGTTGQTYGTYQIEASGETAAITSYAISAVRLGQNPVSDYSSLISINSVTGLITIYTGSGWQIGTYTIDVKVNTESFGTEAADRGIWNNALTVNIVEEMIFNYDAAQGSHKFATAWSVSPTSTLNSATYSWTDSDAEYTEYLSLDSSTGAISAVKGNQLPENTYQVGVTATMTGLEPVATTYNLTIAENPYYFTYFSYGNNLELPTEEGDAISQFRATNRSQLPGISPSVVSTDLSETGKKSTTWSVEIIQHLVGTTINSSTGALTFVNSTSDFNNANCGIVFVTATSTDPDDDNNTWTVKRPVFVAFSSARNNVTVAYTPFVLRVNPTLGKTYRSSVPVIGGTAAPENTSDFLMDYRRNFYYYDLENSSYNNTVGTISSGLMYDLWTAYYSSIGTRPEYGSKDPLSYYRTVSGQMTEKTDEMYAASLAYVDNSEGENHLTLVVNAGNWTDSKGRPANGVMCGTMTFVTNGTASGINGGSTYAPFIIWFDPDYNE